MSRYFDYWFPPAAPRPRPVKGKERKRFGGTWWGKAWIKVVEAEATYNRASRGRAYARADKVYDVKIGPGKTTGKVEGSSGEEYKVEISCPVLAPSDRSSVLKRLSEPSVAGALLNNELPLGLEGLCSKELLEGLDYDCTCPDPECPCKHIAALFYVLGDEIDHAPQILFALKGINNDEILSALKAAPVRPAPPISTVPAVHRRGRPPGSKNKKAKGPAPKGRKGPKRPRGRPRKALKG